MLKDPLTNVSNANLELDNGPISLDASSAERLGRSLVECSLDITHARQTRDGEGNDAVCRNPRLISPQFASHRVRGMGAQQTGRRRYY